MYKLPSPNARSCGIESKKNIARLSLASTSLQRFCCFLSHSSCRPGENLQRRNVRPEIGTRSYCISFKLVKKIFEKKNMFRKKKSLKLRLKYFWNIEITASLLQMNPKPWLHTLRSQWKSMGPSEKKIQANLHVMKYLSHSVTIYHYQPILYAKNIFEFLCLTKMTRLRLFVFHLTS